MRIHALQYFVQSIMKCAGQLFNDISKFKFNVKNSGILSILLEFVVTVGEIMHLDW